ncbi:MAG: hypothetical protein ACXADY_23100 [Candidatus Hodarchaeales archaeon]|jgi:hypothetical protein
MEVDFALCPHCGCPATDEKMVLGYTKKWYICTNHKRPRRVRIENLRSKSEFMMHAFKPLPRKPEPMPSGPPRERSITWEITRKARWDNYRKRQRILQGIRTNQEQNLSFGELLMSDRSGKAQPAILIENEALINKKLRHYEMHKKNTQMWSTYRLRYSS